MKLLTYILLWFTLSAPTSLRAQKTSSPVADPEMEARIKEAWAEIREYRDRVKKGDTTQGDPQEKFASELFAYYRENTESPIGNKAGLHAFAMWGNLRMVEEIEAAISHIPLETDLWRDIFSSIHMAYFYNKREEDYTALLIQLGDKLTHPKSRSALFFELAEHYHREEQTGKATEYLEKVVALDAHSFDVQKAKRLLYEISSLNVGNMAPDFTAVTMDGLPITLSDHRGKIVLLEFWSTTCGPCLPEIPHLKTLHEELSISDFQIIGITSDKDLTRLKQFLQEKDMTWSQIREPSEWENENIKMGEVLTLYNVFGIPRSFLIDRDGMITAIDFIGIELEKAARKLVAEVDD